MPALLPLDERAPEILFGCEPVMGLTPQGKVPRALVATTCVRVHVVQLQKPGFSAPLTRVIDKGAARPIAIPHLAPHRADADTRWRGVCARFLLSTGITDDSRCAAVEARSAVVGASLRGAPYFRRSSFSTSRRSARRCTSSSERFGTAWESRSWARSSKSAYSCDAVNSTR